MHVRNRRALPGFLGFLAMVVCLALPVPRPVVALLAIATALVFVAAYRKTPMSAQRLAAAMGLTMSVAVGVLGLTGSTGTIVAFFIAVMGVSAAGLNTFFNYCFGCELHHRYMQYINRRAERQSHNS